MQGRLLPPVGHRIQAFPGIDWSQEFFSAQELGLSSIEWIFESPFDKNPLWTASGVREIQRMVDKSGVHVDFVCADYFMESPFVRMPCSADVEHNRSVLRQLIEQASDLGAQGIEIPFVDESEIRSAQEEDELCHALDPCLSLAERMNVKIGLETSLPPDRFEQLLRRIGNAVLKANYDIGNSASLGYDAGEEIAAYGYWINNVHIKDRLRHGRTVKLGLGDADIPRVFRLLHDIDYVGSYTLQAARGENGIGEITTVREYINQINAWICNSIASAS